VGRAVDKVVLGQICL